VAADPWLVPITNLRRTIGSRRQETRSGPVGELAVAGTKVEANSVAEAVASLDSIDGGIQVTAVVTAPWVGECRRCLKPVQGKLRCDVREVYRQRAEDESPEDDEETYPLKGEQLDLSPLVRDALLLELPIAPLCGEDCQGLCPTCGADLNGGPCTCAEVATDPRWSVLDSLKTDPGAASGELSSLVGEGGTTRSSGSA
jgi:uncharacterized protein